MAAKRDDGASPWRPQADQAQGESDDEDVGQRLSRAWQCYLVAQAFEVAHVVPFEQRTKGPHEFCFNKGSPPTQASLFV